MYGSLFLLIYLQAPLLHQSEAKNLEIFTAGTYKGVTFFCNRSKGSVGNKKISTWA